jgi:hypothetical protein
MKLFAIGLVCGVAIAAGGTAIASRQAAPTPLEKRVRAVEYRLLIVEARAARLETFRADCLSDHVYLYADYNGYVKWGVGPPAIYSARFYALSGTSVYPTHC